MIVDVHTHAPMTWEGLEMAPMRPDAPNPGRVSDDDFLRGMGPAEVAITFNIADLGASARDVNDATAAFVRRHPHKLIGFCSVQPKQPDALDELERAVGDLDLKGIKLGPNYQNFDPLGDDAFRVYRRAQELRLPILFHQGTSPVRHADLDFAHPRHMDRIATAFPELRVIMAHMGHPWWIDTICVIRKHPNVYADVSALFYRPWSQWECFRYATEWSVLHKMLFATDFPVATVEETIAGLRRVNEPAAASGLPRVPEDAIEQIIQRDSLELLGLERP